MKTSSDAVLAAADGDDELHEPWPHTAEERCPPWTRGIGDALGAVMDERAGGHVGGVAVGIPFPKHK